MAVRLSEELTKEAKGGGRHLIERLLESSSTELFLDTRFVPWIRRSCIMQPTTWSSECYMAPEQ